MYEHAVHPAVRADGVHLDELLEAAGPAFVDGFLDLKMLDRTRAMAGPLAIATRADLEDRAATRRLAHQLILLDLVVLELARSHGEGRN